MSIALISQIPHAPIKPIGCKRAMVWDWEIHAQCPCGWHDECAFGFIRCIWHPCCPKCGHEKADIWDDNGWKMIKVRWVNTLTWWKPWTWNNGFWESYNVRND